MSHDRIEREIVVDASRERVWAVLTEAPHVSGWFGDSAEIDLRPGGKAVFGWTEHGRHHAVVVRVEPPELFSYRWARGTDTEPGPGNSTLVEFTLTEEPIGTVLRVVETGFSELEGGQDYQENALGENTEGWAAELAELKDYAEQPAG